MIKIGLAATNDAAGLDNKNVSAFIELAQKNDCEVIKGESAFFEPEEAKRVANGLKDCDLIVVTVKGFTWFGECINEFTKLGVPVCCWAVPEPKKEGVLLFNSMTGLNLFTSVANSGREIPAVKWLYGNADDTLFVNRFLTTVGAIRCLKAIKGKKIAIAGGVAEGFVNLEYDKKKVESRFGITIEETDIDKIIDAVLEMKDEEISELAAEIKSSASSFTADEERFVKSCKLICVLKRYFEENNYAGMAVACWTRFQERLDIFPCMAFTNQKSLIIGSIGLFLYFAFVEFATEACISLCTDVRAEIRGTVIGSSFGALAIGSTIGTGVSPVLYTKFGYTPCIIVGTVIVAIALLVIAKVLTPGFANKEKN